MTNAPIQTTPIDDDTARSARGAALVEYVLLAALIAVVAITAVTFLGRAVRDDIGRSGSAVETSAGDSAPRFGPIHLAPIFHLAG